MKLILSVDEMNYTGTLMDLIRFIKIAEGRLDAS
jgi:hypothetical protein